MHPSYATSYEPLAAAEREVYLAYPRPILEVSINYLKGGQCSISFYEAVVRIAHAEGNSVDVLKVRAECLALVIEGEEANAAV